jgi:hypothetical protein
MMIVSEIEHYAVCHHLVLGMFTFFVSLKKASTMLCVAVMFYAQTHRHEHLCIKPRPCLFCHYSD